MFPFWHLLGRAFDLFLGFFFPFSVPLSEECVTSALLHTKFSAFLLVRSNAVPAYGFLYRFWTCVRVLDSFGLGTR